MKKPHFSRTSVIGLVITLVLLGVAAFAINLNGALADDIASATEGEYTVYIPFVARKWKPPLNAFGVEIRSGFVNAIAETGAQGGATWVRYLGIRWDAVEAQDGAIDWTKLATFEQEIKKLNEEGLEPMVIIRGTPTWARMPEYPDHVCGPIRQDALDDFADFVYTMVKKYSQAPYNVRYWELGNEPDVDPREISEMAIYGCWGDWDDPYYGGGYYATMLQSVYPAIKQADPKAQVMIGGLLLVCDPQNPPVGVDVKNCAAAKFFEGIIRAGGANYFDIVAYHAYPLWKETHGMIDWDLTNYFWKHRGGILLGKLDYLQEILAKYSVTKPILMNEGGLICTYWETDPNFPLCQDGQLYEDQSNYMVRLYVRTLASELIGSSWYTLNGPGWRESGLLDADQQPRPAYDVMAFMTVLLEDARYLGVLANDTLEGYAFSVPRTGRTIQVYWSNDATTFNVPKPAGTVAVYDRLGNVLDSSSVSILVGFDPILIEIAP